MQRRTGRCRKEPVIPIHLPAPQGESPRDGKGITRLSIVSLGRGPIGTAQCALRPRSYPALFESWNTTRASWGGNGACIGDGACRDCLVLTAPSRRLRSRSTTVAVRLLERTSNAMFTGNLVQRPYVMYSPERGWATGGVRWSWHQLARLLDWDLGRQFRDEHGPGFWLTAATAAALGDPVIEPKILTRRYPGHTPTTGPTGLGGHTRWVVTCPCGHRERAVTREHREPDNLAALAAHSCAPTT